MGCQSEPSVVTKGNCVFLRLTPESAVRNPPSSVRNPFFLYWLPVPSYSLCKSTIFSRDQKSHRRKVSMFINYAGRLTADDFEVYPSRKKRLFPRNADLRTADA
ncbi:cilia- and flagella-associated protein 299 [Cuculus canorus]|uniref:cilia- and flagella-associated protein 299 n=1 Tax=Cuculus canorus TaxID=55661 RepID=UPI0023AB5035|nr:cilia- and flagella-associated protein 299 [Cuculus canorus]